jgi:hypothetical protein
MENLMVEKITLSFAENHKYRLEFFPSDFWASFAASYKGLPWEEERDGRLSIIAENYSYLLDLLVQARLFYLSGKREDARFQ